MLFVVCIPSVYMTWLLCVAYGSRFSDSGKDLNKAQKKIQGRIDRWCLCNAILSGASVIAKLVGGIRVSFMLAVDKLAQDEQLKIMYWIVLVRRVRGITHTTISC